jgi:ribosomal protein S18 acetylase RimI-like enzyme
VLPTYRRRGVGAQLIAYVEAQALSWQFDCVRCGVRLAFGRLRAYYERLGYRVIEYRKHEGYAEPTYAILEKKLAASKF